VPVLTVHVVYYICGVQASVESNVRRLFMNPVQAQHERPYRKGCPTFGLGLLWDAVGPQVRALTLESR
jgi:hypothetical protein